MGSRSVNRRRLQQFMINQAILSSIPFILLSSFFSLHSLDFLTYSFYFTFFSIPQASAPRPSTESHRQPARFKANFETNSGNVEVNQSKEEEEEEDEDGDEEEQQEPANESQTDEADIQGVELGAHPDSIPIGKDAGNDPFFSAWLERITLQTTQELNLIRSMKSVKTNAAAIAEQTQSSVISSFSSSSSSTSSSSTSTASSLAATQASRRKSKFQKPTKPAPPPVNDPGLSMFDETVMEVHSLFETRQVTKMLATEFKQTLEEILQEVVTNPSPLLGKDARPRHPFLRSLDPTFRSFGENSFDDLDDLSSEGYQSDQDIASADEKSGIPPWQRGFPYPPSAYDPGFAYQHPHFQQQYFQLQQQQQDLLQQQQQQSELGNPPFPSPFMHPYFPGYPYPPLPPWATGQPPQAANPPPHELNPQGFPPQYFYPHMYSYYPPQQQQQPQELPQPQDSVPQPPQSPLHHRQNAISPTQAPIATFPPQKSTAATQSEKLHEEPIEKVPPPKIPSQTTVAPDLQLQHKQQKQQRTPRFESPPGAHSSSSPPPPPPPPHSAKSQQEPSRPPSPTVNDARKLREEIIRLQNQRLVQRFLFSDLREQFESVVRRRLLFYSATAAKAAEVLAPKKPRTQKPRPVDTPSSTTTTESFTFPVPSSPAPPTLPASLLQELSSASQTTTAPQQKNQLKEAPLPANLGPSDFETLYREVQELKALVKMSLGVQLDLQKALIPEVPAPSQTPPPSTSSPSALPSKVAKIEEPSCVLCKNASASCLLYRCGHLCCCETCGLRLQQESSPCPICKAPVVDVVKVHK